MPPPLASRAIKPLIGAQVLADKQALLGGKHAAEIRELLEARGVLVFPGVHFDDAGHIAFTRTLGRYEPDRPGGEVTPISVDPAGGSTAQYTRASFFWHFDGYFNEVPVLASIMRPVVLSETGGETEFCNTYAAFEELPEARKAQLDGLRAVHALAGAQLAVEPEPDFAMFQQWQQVRSSKLPLVWRHRSGRKSLVLGWTATRVVGMDAAASDALIARLIQHAEQPQFVYRHHWQMGDVVMWDNTGTMHRVQPFEEGSKRYLHRVTLAGEEPLVAA